jgi:hypothetical protein
VKETNKANSEIREADYKAAKSVATAWRVCKDTLSG